MTEPNRDLSLAQARSLIDSYAFDLGRYDVEQLLEHWLKFYSASWIRLATIESLYLGRYKAVSIEQIMSVWLRRGTSNLHFNYEFERLICRKLPKHLSDITNCDRDCHETLEAEPKVDVAATQAEAIDLEEAVKLDTLENNISLISALGLSYQSNWSELTEGSKIHQFIPLPDVSSFVDKLKTFGERGLESQ
jgi:hypothetical protein